MLHRLSHTSLWAGWIVVLHCSCGYATDKDCLDPAFEFNQHVAAASLA